MKREDILKERYIAIPESVTSDLTLSPAAKLVYGVLLNHLGANESCWPGTSRIAKATGLKTRSVKNCIKALQNTHLIRVIGSGRNHVNVYELAAVSSEKSSLLESRSEKNAPPATMPSGEKSSLPVVDKIHHQSGKKFTTGSEKNAPELLNRTTPSTTEGEPKPIAASPPAAADASGSPAALPLSDGQINEAEQTTPLGGQRDEVEQTTDSFGQHVDEEQNGAEPETGLAPPTSSVPPISGNGSPVWADTDYDPDAPEPVEFAGLDENPESEFALAVVVEEPADFHYLADAPEMSYSASVPLGTSKAGPAVADSPAPSSCDPGPASTPAPSALPAKPTMPRKKSAKPSGRQAMADEDKALICHSANNMQVWLCYGMAGLKTKEGESWPPHECTSWRVHQPADGYTDFQNWNLEQWSLQQIAGYYWARVSAYRQNHGIPITIPALSAVIGCVKNIDKTMPRAELLKYIDTVCDHVDLIKAMNGNYGANLTFDETTLSVKAVRGTVDRINNMSDSDVVDLYRQHKLN